MRDFSSLISAAEKAISEAKALMKVFYEFIRILKTLH
ncbi:hypothetical protein SDC9_173490 [bioreactor metagenome]|uniref:Uncharacterized protein n=1 Tax=bioreactor metagenome TaxID=1076179 RepID=A0A645GGM5_9ZZZZ